MLYITFFLTITFLLYGFFIWQAEKRQRIKNRLSSVFKRNNEIVEDADEKVEKKKNAIGKIVFGFLLTQVKRMFRRSMRRENQEKLEFKLMQAGNPFGMTAVDFRLLQVVLFFVFPIACTGYGLLLNLSQGVIFLLILTGFGVAYLLPKYYLILKTKARNKLALRELPDLLDLLTVSLEAGLGFDGAMSKVVSKKQGVLPQEFQRCLEEMRLGKTRREALSGIRDRLMIDEIRALISSIIQAEKLGIGMVQVLRVQSAEVRDQRKQRAEEEAMKAPIKMLFPLVFFIFPSLFIVLLGPAIIQFLQAF